MDKMPLLITQFRRDIEFVECAHLIIPVVQHLADQGHQVKGSVSAHHRGRDIDEKLCGQELFCLKTPIAVYVRVQQAVTGVPHEVGVLHRQPGAGGRLVPEDHAQPERMVLIGLDGRILFQRQRIRM